MSLSIGCTDWHADDIQLDPEDKGRRYTIYAFGRTAKTTLVTLIITGFQPCGYVEIPQDCTLSDTGVVSAFHEFFESTMQDGQLKYYAFKSIANVSVVHRQRFRGFDANTIRRYVKIECVSRSAIRAISRLFLKDVPGDMPGRRSQAPKPVYIQGITRGGKQVLQLNEFGIDPLLRFFHIQGIKPANWITVDRESIRKSPLKTLSKITMRVDWKDVHPLETPPCEIPWVVASFDCECISSHGDFPQPLKNYKKPARDILEAVDNMKNDQLLPPAQFGVFLEKWFLGMEDGSREDPITPQDLPDDMDAAWGNIHGIFTKRGDRPTANQIRRLSTEMWPIVFDQRGTPRPPRVEVLMEIMAQILEPRVQIAPDRVVEIGTTFWRYGEQEPYRRTMVTLGPCAPIEDVEVQSFDSEADLLVAWYKIIRSEMPDILTGYNIFGFDIPFLYKRAQDLGVLESVFKFSRLRDHLSELKTKQVKGVGGNLVNQEYIDTPGLVQLDLMKIIQRDHNLDSYKLDNVSATFLRGKVKSVFPGSATEQAYVESPSIAGLDQGNCIFLRTTAGYVEEQWGKSKYEVDRVDLSTHRVYLQAPMGDTDKIPDDLTWCMGKNDITPKDIYHLCKGSAEEQRIIAKYCVQDCVLVVNLLKQLQVLPNNVAMGNVCMVPFGWIVARGQGVKIQSLVANECLKRGFILPDLDKTKFGRDSFEGAVVLPPTPGLYLEEPVAVLDYASLYPSSMISVNLSHECYCDDPYWQGEEGAARLTKLGLEYEDVPFDTFSVLYTSGGREKCKVKNGSKTVRCVQNTKGIIPRIMENMLTARKATRKKMKYKTVVYREGSEEYEVSGAVSTPGDGKMVIKEDNGEVVEIPEDSVVSVADSYSPFEKEVMNGQQLAYKVTANSIYGQIGAVTSYIYWKDLAAATTATGRRQLEIAKEYCEDSRNFPQVLEDGRTIHLNNSVVYGDTDSVFVKYDCRYPDGSKMSGRDALKRSIDLGCQSEKGIQELLKAPQRLEYEKTFWPFILFTKKRYVGDKYEFDPNKSKRTSMGIVLKRRDNAPIVKQLFGGCIDTIMESRDLVKALTNLQRGLFDLVRGNVDIRHLIISKTLNPYYARPQSIAHRVLADRMFDRDPGSAPKVNDRIPHVYIKIKKAKSKIKTGENIEDPGYVKEKKLKIDYTHYVSNQIMKPVTQIFALAPHKVPGSKVDEKWFPKMVSDFIAEGMGEEEALKKSQAIAQKLIASVIFGDVLRDAKNRDNNQMAITDFFG